MLNIREAVLERINISAWAQFLTLASVATFLPLFIHLQWLTGPIVNAVLILVLFLSGLRLALVVACLPSLMALSSGLLPAVLAPTVSFIIASNFLFILSINWFYQKNQDDYRGYWLGALSGAGLKFAFLLLSVNILAAFFIKQNLVVLVAKMMGWMQLVTALLGALIAYGILRFLKYFK